VNASRCSREKNLPLVGLAPLKHLEERLSCEECMEKRVAVVTGGASGIGLATVEELARRGCAVYSGDRSFSVRQRRGNIVELPLDVADQASVEAFVSEVLLEAGRIDWLVNNAGYGVAGSIEEISLDEAHAQFETNLFGVARMTRRVLPVMRRQGHGRVVIIGSGAGTTAEPYAGYYTASKFALEGFAESLHHELAPFPVHVSIIAPGWFRTAIVRTARHAALRLPEYAPFRAAAEAAAASYCDTGPTPDVAARLIARVLETKKPRLRYRVGRDVKTSYFLRWLLPERWFHPIIHRYYRLHEPSLPARSVSSSGSV
jgi:NAD(P)-dependent dehydrogenase (short-subunit alcohol dehydrogenase family)